jgi:hypothetical protein
MAAMTRSGPAPATAIACIALAVALSGTSYAAFALPAKSVGTRHLNNDAVVSAKVKDRSLLARDFRRGQLPKGATGRPGPVGPAGPAGPQGPKGDTGTVDASNFYTKAETESRFLGSASKAADADELDGLDSAAFQKRVAGTCAEGSAVRAIAESGTVTCESDTGAQTIAFNVLPTGAIEGPIAGNSGQVTSTRNGVGNYTISWQTGTFAVPSPFAWAFVQPHFTRTVPLITGMSTSDNGSGSFTVDFGGTDTNFSVLLIAEGVSS